jgi:hypothetical protein
MTFGDFASVVGEVTKYAIGVAALLILAASTIRFAYDQDRAMDKSKRQPQID